MEVVSLLRDGYPCSFVPVLWVHELDATPICQQIVHHRTNAMDNEEDGVRLLVAAVPNPHLPGEQRIVLSYVDH